MNKLKNLTKVIIVCLVIILALTGILLVLDLISLETAMESSVRMLLIFGILTAMSAIIIGFLNNSSKKS